MNHIFSDILLAFRRRDNALMQIILINIAVFVAANLIEVVFYLSGAKEMATLLLSYFKLPMNPEVLLFRPWTLVSYFFFHTQFFHILFNMLFLYWFGDILTQFLGNKRLTAVYFLGGLAGAFIAILAVNLIPVLSPFQPSFLVGASGAVYAVVVAAATLVPHVQMNLLFFGPVKISYIAAGYVLLSLFAIKDENPGGNLAHLGGAFMGFLFIWQLRKGYDWGSPFYRFSEWFTSLSKPAPKKVKTYKSTYVTVNQGQQVVESTTDHITQEEIDRILDKISLTGYDSLSKKEKQTLFKYSQNP